MSSPSDRTPAIPTSHCTYDVTIQVQTETASLSSTRSTKKFASKKSTSLKISRNSREDSSIELCVASIAVNPHNYRKFRKKDVKNTQREIKNDRSPMFIDGVITQPYHNMVTSFSLKENNHAEEVSRKLPSLVKHDVTVGLLRHKHQLSSPTLGEIAIERKLTHRLPSRKIHKRWPNETDKNHFHFGLSFERNLERESSVTGHEMVLESPNLRYKLPELRQRTSRKKRNIPGPDNCRNRRNKVADEHFNFIKKQNLIFRYWTLPQIEPSVNRTI